MVSIPEHAASMLLPLLATYWTSSELIGHRWFTKTLAVHGVATVRLDGEGRRRRVAMVDCSCEGANTHCSHAQVKGCSTSSVMSLCTDTYSAANCSGMSYNQESPMSSSPGATEALVHRLSMPTWANSSDRPWIESHEFAEHPGSLSSTRI